AVAVLGHAHHHVPDALGVDAGVLEGGADGEAAELGGRQVREQARPLVVDEDVGAREAASAVEDHDGLHALSHSWRNTAGTRGPFWMKFFMPMSMSTVSLQRAKPSASMARPSAS